MGHGRQGETKGRLRVLAACLVCVCLVGAVACQTANDAGDSASSASVVADSGGALAAFQAAGGGSDASDAASFQSALAQRQAGAEGDPDDDGEILRWSNGAEYRGGEVLVELAEGMSAADFNARIATLDFIATDRITEEDATLGWTTLKLADGQAVEGAIERLQEEGVVASAQPNFVYHTMGAQPSASADTWPLGQSGMLAAGMLGTQAYDEWQLDAVRARTAWATRKTSHAVTVAVMDSGCNVAHPDLKANIVDTYNVLDKTKSVADATGHGTHVAGIVSAVPDNGVGIAGVSYNAGLLPIKVMKDDTTDTSKLVSAYEYVMKNAQKLNIRVVNMSLGAKQSALDAADAALLRAIDKAYRANILSVFAAGNDDEKTPYYCFPCDFVENGVGVINVDEFYTSAASVAGTRRTGTNYNLSGEKTKDLSAPGENIVSTLPNSKYGTMSGTSMACPVVAGVAALVFAENPKLSAGEAKSVLCSTAQDLFTYSNSKKVNVGFDVYTGYGLVRADLAVAGASKSYIAGNDAVAVGGTTALSVPQSGSWTWASSNTGILSVSAKTGKAKGIAPGEAVVSATNGTTTLYRTVVVYQVKLRGVSSVAIGKTISLSGWSNPVAMWTYSSSNTKVATVGSTTGTVKGKKAGTVTITAKLSACPSIAVTKKVKVTKLKNPMTVSAKSKAYTCAQLRSKARAFAGVTFKTKAKGKVTYAKVAKGSSSQLTVNKKTGKVTVRKNTPRGTYKVRIKVKAAGNASYQATTKTVTVKVTVR